MTDSSEHSLVNVAWPWVARSETDQSEGSSRLLFKWVLPLWTNHKRIKIMGLNSAPIRSIMPLDVMFSVHLIGCHEAIYYVYIFFFSRMYQEYMWNMKFTSECICINVPQDVKDVILVKNWKCSQHTNSMWFSFNCHKFDYLWLWSCYLKVHMYFNDNQKSLNCDMQHILYGTMVGMFDLCARGHGF